MGSAEVLNPLRFSQILTQWIVFGADFGDGYYGSCEMLRSTFRSLLFVCSWAM